MKKQIEIVIDLTKSEKEIWEQINEASRELKKLGQKKPWYKRIFSWF